MNSIVDSAGNSLLDGVAEAGTSEHLQPCSQAPFEGAAPQEVLEALRKIVASPGFAPAIRLRRLLEYLVTETLQGRGSRIKAYSIATEVLGRPASFDPQKDPIVRIEAARLRRELEHYYLTDGRDDPVVIDVPKGAYVPRFKSVAPPAGGHEASREDADATAVHAPLRTPAWNRMRALAAAVFLVGGAILMATAWLASSNAGRDTGGVAGLRGPGVIVKPLVDLSPGTNTGSLAQGLTERIIEKTTRFKEIAVIAGDGRPTELPATDVRYEFGGSLRLTETSLLVQTRLVDRTDGRVMWADSFDIALEPQQLFNVEVQVADQIATRIAEPSGIVFEAERRQRLDEPPETWDAYLCTLSAYAYRVRYGTSQHAPVRACLERAVAEHPDFAAAWALLSLAYLDEVRFFYPPPPGNDVPALKRGYDAARRAIALDPTNIRGQQALMMTYFFQENYAAAIKVGDEALSLNPNDLEFKGDYGSRLALYGQWDKGCGLVEEALTRSARKNAYQQTILALCHYMKGDLTTASRLIIDADAADNPGYRIMAAAILAEDGRMAEAQEHVEWLSQNASAKLPALLLQVPRRLVRAEDRARFTASIRKAGLDAGS